jgi:hypothetical protein
VGGRRAANCFPWRSRSDPEYSADYAVAAIKNGRAFHTYHAWQGYADAGVSNVPAENFTNSLSA